MELSLVEKLVGTVFAIWFILSILNQFDSAIISRMSAWDLFQFIPKWTFFAPNPGVTDFHLFYRTIGNSEEKGKFIEYPIQKPKNFSTWIFNPDKRETKAFYDLVLDLQTFSNQPNLFRNSIKISLPYLTILNALSSKIDKNKSIQFMILESYGFNPSEKTKIVFLSDTHAI